MATISTLTTRWAKSVIDELPPHARRLTDVERDIARASGVENVEAIHVVKVDRVPFPDVPRLAALCNRYGFLGSQTLGLTLGHVLYLTEAAAESIEILAHECCHVAQTERLGSIDAFIRKYISELVEYGYAFAPLELEARRVGGHIASEHASGEAFMDEQ